MKPFGAQKIYCFKQGLLTNGDGSANSSSVDELKAKLQCIQTELSKTNTELESITAKLNMYTQHKSAVTRQSQFISRLNDLHRQINSIESTRTISDVPLLESGDDLQRSLEQAITQLSVRKRIGNDLIGYVSESCSISRREVIDDLGLELDDELITTTLPRGC